MSFDFLKRSSHRGSAKSLFKSPFIWIFKVLMISAIKSADDFIESFSFSNFSLRKEILSKNKIPFLKLSISASDTLFPGYNLEIRGIQ